MFHQGLLYTQLDPVFGASDAAPSDAFDRLTVKQERASV
jgi:hypothetical protein